MATKEQTINLGQDISNIERGKTSDIIPNGEYQVEVSECREDDKNGKVQVVVGFTVKADTEGGKYNGCYFMEFFSLKPTALWKIALFLDAVYGQTFKGKEFPVKDVIGKRVTVRTQVDDYEGRESTKVVKYAPAARFSGGESKAENKSVNSNEDVSL